MIPKGLKKRYLTTICLKLEFAFHNYFDISCQFSCATSTYLRDIKAWLNFLLVTGMSTMLCSSIKKQTTFQRDKKNKILCVCVCVKRCNSYLWKKFLFPQKRDNIFTFSSYAWSCLHTKPWQLWGTVMTKVIFGFYCPRMEYSQYNWNRYLLWHIYRSLLSIFRSQCSPEMHQNEVDFSRFQ